MRWHYTIRDRLDMILKSGTIRPATAGVVAPEIPVVWFTESDDWEPTANKLFAEAGGIVRSLSREETEARGGELIRIGVGDETVPHPYADLVTIASCPRHRFNALTAVARRQGSNPDQWFFTLKSVPYQLWCDVEEFSDGDWREMTGLHVVDSFGMKFALSRPSTDDVIDACIRGY